MRGGTRSNDGKRLLPRARSSRPRLMRRRSRASCTGHSEVHHRVSQVSLAAHPVRKSVPQASKRRHRGGLADTKDPCYGSQSSLPTFASNQRPRRPLRKRMRRRRRAHPRFPLLSCRPLLLQRASTLRPPAREDWDVAGENDNDAIYSSNDDDDDYAGARGMRRKLAQAFFGGGGSKSVSKLASTRPVMNGASPQNLGR